MKHGDLTRRIIAAAMKAPACLQIEKQIKGWLRVKKIALIESTNPEWKDLSEEWSV